MRRGLGGELRRQKRGAPKPAAAGAAVFGSGRARRGAAGSSQTSGSTPQTSPPAPAHLGGHDDAGGGGQALGHLHRLNRPRPQRLLPPLGQPLELLLRAGKNTQHQISAGSGAAGRPQAGGGRCKGGGNTAARTPHRAGQAATPAALPCQAQASAAPRASRQAPPSAAPPRLPARTLSALSRFLPPLSSAPSFRSSLDTLANSRSSYSCTFCGEGTMS